MVEADIGGLRSIEEIGLKPDIRCNVPERPVLDVWVNDAALWSMSFDVQRHGVENGLRAVAIPFRFAHEPCNLPAIAV